MEKEIADASQELYGFNQDVIAQVSTDFGTDLSEEGCLTQLECLEEKGLVNSSFGAGEIVWTLSSLGREVFEQQEYVREESLQWGIRDALGELERVSF